MVTRPFIFAFYSFKGGVGRSMALLNVAHDLVSRGRSVLVVDMDLEAPGLTNLLDRRGELEDPSSSDVLDLLTAVRDVAENGDQTTLGFDSTGGQLPRLDSFITHVKRDAFCLGGKVSGAHLDVIGCRLQDDSYLRRLSNLQLGGMPRERLLKMGRILREMVHAGVTPMSLPAYWPGKQVGELPYDYVLVDSRTGYTEIGGLCVGPLSDRVIMFSGLNDQNIQGTMHFAKTVGLIPIRDPGAFFANNVTTKGEKPALIVGSPVTYGERKLRDERVSAIQADGGQIATTLPYDPEMALKERIFVRDLPDEFLSHEYRKLTTLIMEFVGDDAKFLVRKAQGRLSQQLSKMRAEEHALVSQGKLAYREVPSRSRYLHLVQRPIYEQEMQPTGAASYAEVLGDLVRVLRDRPSLAEPLVDQVIQAFKESTEADYLAVDRFFSVLEDRGTFEPSVLSANWGMALVNFFEMLNPAGEDDTVSYMVIDEQTELLKVAEAKLRQSQSVALDNSGQFVVQSSLARAMWARAMISNGDESDALFDESRQLWDEISKKWPGFVSTFLQMANTYRDQGRRRGDSPKTDEFFSNAYASYQAALNLDKSDERRVSILWSWARALQFHGQKKTGNEAHALFDRAYGKFKEAEHAAGADSSVREIEAQWGESLLDEAFCLRDKAVLDVAISKITSARLRGATYRRNSTNLARAAELKAELTRESVPKVSGD
jgi:tetratricopeptide (TPR) repeat protein